MEYFVRGKTLIRYIRSLYAYHFGILAEVNCDNIMESKVIDFDIDDKVHLYSLREFLYGENVFWIHTWKNEPKRIIESIREPREIVLKALDLLELREKNSTKFPIYSIQDNNCEHFVRICTFRNKEGYISRQIDRIVEDSRLAWFRLGALMVINSVGAESKTFINEPKDAIRCCIRKNKIYLN